MLLLWCVAYGCAVPIVLSVLVVELLVSLIVWSLEVVVLIVPKIELVHLLVTVLYPLVAPFGHALYQLIM